ncbi:MAG: hypothetical protein WKF96_13130 [Solirubrobacteraceae bacterium]
MEQTDPIERMTPAELDALRGAAAWYAKYNHAKIEDALDDRSAYAMIRRERYIALVSALHKLGFDMALPDALAAELRSAA